MTKSLPHFTPKRSLALFVALFGFGGIIIALCPAPSAADQLSTIKGELTVLDQQIEDLPQLEISALPTGINPYWSTPHTLKDGHDSYWVQLDFGRPITPTLIALIPDYNHLGQILGFPKYFTLTLSNDPDAQHSHFLHESAHEPFKTNEHFVPIFQNPQNLTGRYLRFTILGFPPHQPRLPPPEEIFCRLSEILVHQEATNLALNASITSSMEMLQNDRNHISNLNDGWSPLNLPVNPTTTSTNEGFHSYHSGGKTVPDQPYWAQVDLGSEQVIDQINLIPVTPKSFRGIDGYGFPTKFTITASNDPDFHQSSVLFDSRITPSPLPGHHLFSLPAQGIQGRFIRITVFELHPGMWGSMFYTISEMEVISDGENIALGKAVESFQSLDDIYINAERKRIAQQQGQTMTPEEIARLARQRIQQSFQKGHMVWGDAGLTDGFSSKHRLLPMPEWLLQIKQRALLEEKRTHLKSIETTFINTKIQQTERRFHVGIFIAIFILIVLIIFFYRRHQLSQRAMRMQLAQDLHDNLSSDLSNIALISQTLNQDHPQESTTLRNRLRAISHTAQRSMDAIRDIIHFTQENATSSGELLEWLEQQSHSMLSPLNIPFSFQITPSSKFDVIISGDLTRKITFIFKEILTNICKHSEATEVTIKLTIKQKTLLMEVVDNGIGLPPAPQINQKGLGITSIKKRIKKLHGTFKIKSEKFNGTQINIQLPLKS